MYIICESWAHLWSQCALRADLSSTTGNCENDRHMNPTWRLKLKPKHSLLSLTCRCHGSLFSIGRKRKLFFKERWNSGKRLGCFPPGHALYKMSQIRSHGGFLSCDPKCKDRGRYDHTQMHYLYSIIEIWKLESQEYKKDDLHSTFTLTVRLTGTPTLLAAVHRYVPFALLWILLRTYFPEVSRGSLSVPSSSTLVQVMFGGGMPVALQLKATNEPSQATWSLLTLAILGGTAKIVLK